MQFDCTGGIGSLKNSEPQGSERLRVETLTGQVSKTSTGHVSVPPGLSVVCFNTKGTLLARAPDSEKIILIPPRSATYIRGGARLLVQAARGEHVAQIVSWPSNFSPVLEGWVAGRATERAAHQQNKSIACKPIDPHLADVYDRFEAARSGPEAVAEPLMLATVIEIVVRLMTGSDQVQLAPIPIGLPDTIQDLIEQVRVNPPNPWPLKDAADTAGYSPFHFSRVFKSLVGYGFHEYVDRCRTEMAVQMLCDTANPVDAVAASCGFGTTQGLRESIKEYLGLVPSELRAVPEAPGMPNDYMNRT